MPGLDDLLAGPKYEVEVDERRNDLAKLRALSIQKAILARQAESGHGSTSPFEHAMLAGLTRPVSAGVEAMSPWNHPGSTVGERWRGGLDAYDAGQERQWNESPYMSGAQNIAGSLLGGGAPIKAAKSAPWLAETAYDAGTAGVQTLAEGGSLSDAAKDAVLNSGIGGFISGYGKSQKARKNILKGRR